MSKCAFEGCDGKNNIDPKWRTHTSIDSCPKKKCSFPSCDGAGSINKRRNYHNDMQFCPLFDLAKIKAAELSNVTEVYQYYSFNSKTLNLNLLNFLFKRDPYYRKITLKNDYYYQGVN